MRGRSCAFFLHVGDSRAYSRLSILSLTKMVSKRLMGVWLALDGLLLISGLISVILSQAWRVPNVLMNLVLSSADLMGS